MTMDEVLTRVQGSVDLLAGRSELGWRRLDVSPDGFWNSFVAIPASLPALLLLWLSHASWLTEAGSTSDRSIGYVVGALATIEVVVWLLTVALFLFIAKPMRWGDRAVQTIIAVNWASVLFAYVRAVPAALALLVGLGEGISFLTVVVALITVVAYGRLLTVAIARPLPVVAGVFVASIALGFVLSDAGYTLFGLEHPG